MLANNLLLNGDTSLLNDTSTDKEISTHSIEIRKVFDRKVSLKAAERHLNYIMERALAGGRKGKGWNIKIQNENWMNTFEEEGSSLNYTVFFELTCESARKEEAITAEFVNIVKLVTKAAASQKGGFWELGLVDGQSPADLQCSVRATSLNYVDIEIPHNWTEYFKHLYNRESQVDIVRDVVQAAIDSQFNNRYHIAMIGDPASGKTEIFRSLKKAVGEDAVMEFDATATTMAGAIKELDSRDMLPRIMIVEEIEKANEDSLRWFLALMDQRAEIRKTTNRSNIQRETKMLTFATVNDYPLFKRMLAGALASRFSFHLYCPGLDNATLGKILQREVLRVHGKIAWIQPTLDFGDKYGIKDPRRLTAICLAGKDNLINESFQRRLEDCNPEKFLAQYKELHK